MKKGFEPGCIADVFVFGLLAYVGHPTWWLEGNHDSPALLVILPAYYFFLAVMAMGITVVFKVVGQRAVAEREKSLAAGSTVSVAAERESGLRTVLILYCVIGLLALFLDTTRPTMPSGWAYGLFVLCDAAQFFLFVAILVSLRKLSILLLHRPYAIPAILACSIVVSLVHYATVPEPKLTTLTGLANTREEEIVILATGVGIRLVLIALAAWVGRTHQASRAPALQ